MWWTFVRLKKNNNPKKHMQQTWVKKNTKQKLGYLASIYRDFQPWNTSSQMASWLIDWLIDWLIAWGQRLAISSFVCVSGFWFNTKTSTMVVSCPQNWYNFETQKNWRIRIHSRCFLQPFEACYFKKRRYIVNVKPPPSCLWFLSATCPRARQKVANWIKFLTNSGWFTTFFSHQQKNDLSWWSADVQKRKLLSFPSLLLFSSVGSSTHLPLRSGSLNSQDSRIYHQALMDEISGCWEVFEDP